MIGGPYRPSLSVLTPDPARPAPPAAFLARCEELGLLAYQFADPEMLVGETRQPAVLSTLFRSPWIMQRVQRCLLRAAESGLRTIREELFPGCTLGVIAHRAGPQPAGLSAVLLLQSGAFTTGSFQDWCAQSGVNPQHAVQEATPFVREAASDAALLLKALLAAANDLEALDEQRSAIDGFTVQLTDSYDTMDLLYSVGRSMREPFKPRQFLSFVCGRLFAARSFRWMAICFASQPGVAAGLRGLLVHHGQLPGSEASFRAACGPFAGAAGLAQVLERVPGLCSPECPQLLMQPLICKGAPVGVLIAGGKYGDDPDVSSYDIQLIEAAGGYINAFSDSVALYEDQHNLFMGTVGAMTAAIDAKDRYTFGHSERVAQVASQLALVTGMSPEQAERVRIAGLVHDVGKIGVPESVLTKQGKLDEAEFAHIRKHPEIGYNILRDIRLLDDVLPGVLHHHERFDGKGYPHGLAGSDIPLIARILAVADTFDAMSSNRSYRSAMARDVVLAEVVKCSGSQFDPALALAFATMDLSTYDAMVARHAAGHMKLAA